jgi:hypothetical protein
MGGSILEKRPEPLLDLFPEKLEAAVARKYCAIAVPAAKTGPHRRLIEGN